LTTTIANGLNPSNASRSNNVHPLGRLLFGLGFFTAALIAHDIAIAIAGIVLCLVLLRVLNRSWTSVFRAIRLLLWLILPICMLHVFLTPGALIWPGSDLPFTWEGVDRAMWLSTRLLFLFFSAMLLSRILSLDEWQAQLCRIPIVGHRLYPYLQLFRPIQQTTKRLAHKHWHKNRSRGIVSIPGMMVDLLEDVLHAGHAQAKSVWEDWKGELPVCVLHMDGRTWVLATLGFSLPVMAWVF